MSCFSPRVACWRTSCAAVVVSCPPFEEERLFVPSLVEVRVSWPTLPTGRSRFHSDTFSFLSARRSRGAVLSFVDADEDDIEVLGTWSFFSSQVRTDAYRPPTSRQIRNNSMEMETRRIGRHSDTGLGSTAVAGCAGFGCSMKTRSIWAGNLLVEIDWVEVQVARQPQVSTQPHGSAA